ncbi:MAG: phosphopentomutase [Clostridia bacterium]|nr:phosphopentomutase [Clostridia bacterium]
MNKKITIIVLDGVGTGLAPDAKEFGDEGADSLGSVFKKFPDVKLPNMARLGILNMRNEFNKENHTFPDKLEGSYGRCAEKSMGKDTTIGHWEMAGIITPKPFPTYPDGFPKEIIDEFVNQTGCGVIGNKPASGTEIIMELGREHLETKKLIVYTSADSVFQIAAHDSIYPIDKLYDICEKARGILKGEHAVARVIARPFTGEYPNFKRTADRKDFSLKPTEPTMLNYVMEAGMETVGVGKIEDIFNKYGISKAIHTHGNPDCLEATLKEIQRDFSGILFVNLVDTDMVYGHRNDIEGFAKSLEATDKYIGEYMKLQGENDLLIITADHGVDPGYPGSDHTRECVPLLIYSKSIDGGKCLGTREAYTDIAATCMKYLNLDSTKINGKPFI